MAAKKKDGEVCALHSSRAIGIWGAIILWIVLNLLGNITKKPAPLTASWVTNSIPIRAGKEVTILIDPSREYGTLDPQRSPYEFEVVCNNLFDLPIRYSAWKRPDFPNGTSNLTVRLAPGQSASEAEIWFIRKRK